MLSKWIEDLKSADPNVQILALRELEQLGPAAREAVPLLVPMVDPDGAFMWEGAAPAFAILRIGGEPDQERRAVRNLLGVRFPRSTGMDEGEVLDALTRQHPLERIGQYLVEELPNVRYQWGAVVALANYGAAAVPLLLPGLRQKTGPAQMPYVYALRAIGEPSIPALRQGLRGSSVGGRVGAARTLGLLAGQAQDAFADLVAVLDDAAAEARYSAAQALVQIDASRAGPAAPPLIAGLEAADADVRCEAARLLTQLAEAGQPAAAAIPALSRLLTDPEVRLEAALALVATDAGQAAAAVPVLGEALEQNKPAEIPVYDSSRIAGTEAILKALGRVGQPAAVLAPLLRQALESAPVTIRTSAALVLVQVAPEWTMDAVNRLLPLLSDVDSLDFWTGIAALEEIGPAAREAVPRLEEFLFNEASRGELLECYCPGEPVPLVVAALVKIDQAAPARVLARVEADLQSPDRFDPALRLLLDLAREIPAAAPLLAKLLQDRCAEGRWDDIRKTLGELRLSQVPVGALRDPRLGYATPSG